MSKNNVLMLGNTWCSLFKSPSVLALSKNNQEEQAQGQDSSRPTLTLFSQHSSHSLRDKYYELAAKGRDHLLYAFFETFPEALKYLMEDRLASENRKSSILNQLSEKTLTKGLESLRNAPEEMMQPLQEILQQREEKAKRWTPTLSLE